MLELVWITLGVPALIAAVVASIYILITRSKSAVAERRERMQALAQKLGWRYMGDFNPEAMPFLPPCRLFEKKSVGALRNVMVDDARLPGRLLFDCAFHGTTRRQDWFEVFAANRLVATARVAGDGPSVKVQVYRPEPLGLFPHAPTAYHADIPEDVRFGDYYFFVGEPRREVARIFTASVRQAVNRWMGGNPAPVLEIAGGWVVAYCESPLYRRDAAQKAPHLLHYVTNVAEALGEEPPHEPSQ
jgi:hypothetical protein